MSFRPKRALVNVGRKQRDARLMELNSARREKHLAHVPAQQCAGISRSSKKGGPGAFEKCRGAALPSGPQQTR
jgi:hypothetical protein